MQKPESEDLLDAIPHVGKTKIRSIEYEGNKFMVGDLLCTVAEIDSAIAVCRDQLMKRGLFQGVRAEIMRQQSSLEDSFDRSIILPADSRRIVVSKFVGDEFVVDDLNKFAQKVYRGFKRVEQGTSEHDPEIRREVHSGLKNGSFFAAAHIKADEARLFDRAEGAGSRNIFQRNLNAVSLRHRAIVGPLDYHPQAQEEVSLNGCLDIVNLTREYLHLHFKKNTLIASLQLQRAKLYE